MDLQQTLFEARLPVGVFHIVQTSGAEASGIRIIYKSTLFFG